MPKGDATNETAKRAKQVSLLSENKPFEENKKSKKTEKGAQPCHTLKSLDAIAIYLL
jgi:hypothetical protein